MTSRALTDRVWHLLSSEHDAYWNCLLLVNQAALAQPGSFAGVIKHWPARNLLNPAAPVLDGASPVVLDVTSWRTDRYGDVLLQSLLEEFKWACGISFITTPLSFNEAVEALSGRCNACFDDGYAVVIRYFDTRVLPVLVDALDPAQRAAWTGFASRWLYADRDGDWQVLTIAEENDCESYRSGSSHALVLSHSQQAALMDATECDAVIEQVRRRNPILLSALTPPERYLCIRPLIEAAQSLGIDSTSQLAIFCGVAIGHERDSYLRKRWQAHLDVLRQGDVSFEDWLVMLCNQP